MTIKIIVQIIKTRKHFALSSLVINTTVFFGLNPWGNLPQLSASLSLVDKRRVLLSTYIVLTASLLCIYNGPSMVLGSERETEDVRQNHTLKSIRVECQTCIKFES